MSCSEVEGSVPSSPVETTAPAAPDTAESEADAPDGGQALQAAVQVEPPTEDISSPQAVAAIANLRTTADDLIVACQEQVKLFEGRDAERDADHTRKMAELDQTLATLVETSNQQMAAVNSKRDTLTEEQKSLENTYKFTKSKVKLDIGGTRFTTSRSTLNSCKESLLAAMFSGRYVLQPDEQEASFFIDRDGRYFHHVLNYLRSPREFEPPADLLSLNKILNDASFFRIQPLVDVMTAAIQAKDIYR